MSEAPRVTTPEQRRFFQECGYLVIPGLFSTEEIAAVMAEYDALETERRMREAAGKNRDGMIPEDGATPRLQFDIHRTETRFALLCRHPRVAGLMQELMGMPLSLYHSKLAFKAPFTGSVQYWHQDFGYWQTGHPRPDMGSVLIMLDAHTEDNACLQLLSGSHREGVAPHEVELRQSTGDGQQRIPAASMHDYCRRYPRVKIVGSPGTVLAWHSNTMHASSHNVSEHPRRALIVAFNAPGNRLRPISDRNPFDAHDERPVTLTADDCLLAPPVSPSPRK
jgi:ectoine hydroxylase-related dioxygenase (phytanoyl-CoA dioxygenase family)